MEVQCLLGPTEQQVLGSTYTFQMDNYGRAVATVHNHTHAALFLSCEGVYREALPIDGPAGPTAEELEEDAKRRQAAAEEAARLEAECVAAFQVKAKAELARLEAEEQDRIARLQAEQTARQTTPPAGAAPAEDTLEQETPTEGDATEEVKPLAPPADSTTDNLDAASSTSNDAPAVSLPKPRSRPRARSAAAK